MEPLTVLGSVMDGTKRFAWSIRQLAEAELRFCRR
jgi:hypothetical protein